MAGPHGFRLVRGVAALVTLIVLAGSPGVPVHAWSPSARRSPGPTESGSAADADLAALARGNTAFALDFSGRTGQVSLRRARADAHECRSGGSPARR